MNTSCFFKIVRLRPIAFSLLLTFFMLGSIPSLTQTTVLNRVLKKTHFITNTAVVTATCNLSSCGTFTAIFPQVNIVCPVLAPKTCTYYIALESQDTVTDNDNGFFQFLIDGVAPTPGATDSSGFYSWLSGDPNSGSRVTDSRSYAVIGEVTNSTNNQAHGIKVSIGCRDNDGAGCTATTRFATLRIDVFTP
jgi:hypothetical protein